MEIKGYKVTECKYEIEKGRDASLFGALESGKKFVFTLNVSGEWNAKSAEFMIHSDGYEGDVKWIIIPMTISDKNADKFTLEIDTAELACGLVRVPFGLFYYKYRVCGDGFAREFGGEGVCELQDAENCGERQLLIYKKKSSSYGASHSAYGRGIIYHIFVDRFRRSGKCGLKEGVRIDSDWNGGTPQFALNPGDPLPNNVFFGGDLYGIIEKLPYIASLGTSVIYLSPVFDAATNHKYDTGDYMSVDSMFGGDEALEKLCSEAEKYGIEIMLDGVFNHTGSDSIYFNKNGRYSSLGAYQSKSSPYSRWYNFVSFPEKYESWWGVDILPRVNSADETYRGFICSSVLPKWSDIGVKHWRLDVADELSELFLEDFSKAVSEQSEDSVIIGEVWEDASDKVSYGRRRHYLSGGLLTSVMNYPLRNAVLSYIRFGDSELLRLATEGLYRRYPKEVSDCLMNFLGTHDTERAISVLGDDDFYGLTNTELSERRMNSEQKKRAGRLLIEAYAIICALPGVPCVFYGDEAGLEGYRDPFCRRPFPWGHEDAEISAEYKKLGMIRRKCSLLKDAYFEIETLDESCFAFIRRPTDGESESLLAVINNTDNELCYALNGDFHDFNGCNYSGNVLLPPRGWIYLMGMTGNKD